MPVVNSLNTLSRMRVVWSFMVRGGIDVAIHKRREAAQDSTDICSMRPGTKATYVANNTKEELRAGSSGSSLDDIFKNADPC